MVYERDGNDPVVGEEYGGLTVDSVAYVKGGWKITLVHAGGDARLSFRGTGPIRSNKFWKFYIDASGEY